MTEPGFTSLIPAIDLLLIVAQAELLLRDTTTERQSLLAARRQSFEAVAQRLMSIFAIPSDEQGAPADATAFTPIATAWSSRPRESCDESGYRELSIRTANALRLLSLCAGEPAATATALIRSVLRPLSIALASSTGMPSHQVASEVDALFRERNASALSRSFEAALHELTLCLVRWNGPGLEVKEALAALLRVSAQLNTSEVGSWQQIESSLKLRSARIRVVRNGPYLAEGDAELSDYLGVPIPTKGLAALCRCGDSQTKPFCEGSHVLAAFQEAKDPRRVPDVCDEYVGQSLTVLDNRGTCAHSGFCTDRLASVFHLGQEPFVTPSGARMDEILLAVRRCPSGALGAAIEDKQMHEFVDRTRGRIIETSKNGPYRLRGGIPVLDELGKPVPRNAGASLEHCSLCRCGSSLNKPFCSGMHWSVGFTDPVMAADHEPTLYEWAGGYPALLDMTTIFYSRHVPSDPVVGPLFARMEADHPERVAAWLSEVFGGPSFYSEQYGGYARMISQHLDKHLTQEQRSHWARLMAQSADEAGLPNDAEFRAAFLAYIEWGSRIAVENSTAGAKPPEGMPVPKWWWVCNATPAARISALATKSVEAPAQPVALDEGEAPSFEKHIKALFRPMDRASMKFAFDLWSHQEVAQHAEAILSRVRAGTMPCDGSWPADKVELFDLWVQTGKAR